MNGQTDKKGYVWGEGICIHSGILFCHKMSEILSFATTWMKLEGIMLSEIRKAQKDKHIFSLLEKLKKGEYIEVEGRIEVN
jgi:hypothetical protein